MEVMIPVMIKIVLLISFGLFLKKAGWIDEHLQAGLNRLLLNAIMPATILTSSQMEVSAEILYNMKTILFLAFGYYGAAYLLASVVFKACRVQAEKKQVSVLMVMFANVGFIGFPIAAELFGVKGTLYTVLFNLAYQLVFFTYGVFVFQGQKKFSMKELVRTPATIASFLCLLLFGFQIRLPDGIFGAIEMVGNMTTPLSLFLIGCMLADLRPADFLEDTLTYIVIGLRMVACPAMVYVVARAMRLTDEAIGTSVILMGMPVASLIAIYAEEYHKEEKFAAKVVVISMLLMLIALPVWMKILAG